MKRMEKMIPDFVIGKPSYDGLYIMLERGDMHEMYHTQENIDKLIRYRKKWLKEIGDKCKDWDQVKEFLKKYDNEVQ